MYNCYFLRCCSVCHQHFCTKNLRENLREHKLHCLGVWSKLWGCEWMAAIQTRYKIWNVCGMPNLNVERGGRKKEKLETATKTNRGSTTRNQFQFLFFTAGRMSNVHSVGWLVEDVEWLTHARCDIYWLYDLTLGWDYGGNFMGLIGAMLVFFIFCIWNVVSGVDWWL